MRTNSAKSPPILYSFRRCPYAIRARMAIAYSLITVEIREVVLKDKPQELTLISAKATVPVLQLNEVTVLDESLDIMLWALKNNDPDAIGLSQCENYRQNALIVENDDVFKIHLDHYKYADRFPDHDAIYYRQQAEIFVKKLDGLLKKHDFLMGSKLSAVDYAIFPFMRQFAHVDKKWFFQSSYEHVQKWLDYFLRSALFNSVMQKYKPWKNTDERIFFPPNT